MKSSSGDEVRNHQYTENDSKEQRDKVKKHQDIEPQAENWNPRDTTDSKGPDQKEGSSS